MLASVEGVLSRSGICARFDVVIIVLVITAVWDVKTCLVIPLTQPSYFFDNFFGASYSDTTSVTLSLQCPLGQCFATFVRPRPGKFFFYTTRARGPTNLLVNKFPIFLSSYINLQEPCVLYIGRAHRYPPNTPFYIFFQKIYVMNFSKMLQTLQFSLFKMLFIS
jgi:hypothetical protein